jgi:hypothetical protein
MAAEGIAAFMAQYPPGTQPNLNDAGTVMLWKDMTQPLDPAGDTLQSLAAAYTSSIGTAGVDAARSAFTNALSNSNITRDSHNWFGMEGPTSNGPPQTNDPRDLTSADITALTSAITAYEQDSTPANLASLQAAIAGVYGQLQTSKAAGPLDPYSQLLWNMLTMPLNDSIGGTYPPSLVNLASGLCTQGTLGSYLFELYNNKNEINYALEYINYGEFKATPNPPNPDPS